MESNLSPNDLFNELVAELYDVVIKEGDCLCHGHLRQLDGYIAPGIPVRILEEGEWFRVNIGKITNNTGPRLTKAALLAKLGISLPKSEAD